jgi:hypothetical protein
MATTHNQEFLHLQDESKQHKVDIQRMTYKIASKNSCLDSCEAKVTGELTEIKGEFSSLTQ